MGTLKRIPSSEVKSKSISAAIHLDGIRDGELLEALQSRA
jgi:hypothetical protein